MNKPPATPGELNVSASIYQQVVSGKDEHGAKKYKYVLRRNVMLKEQRQKSSSEVLAHSPEPEWKSNLVLNWWDCRDVEETDVIVYGEQCLQMGLKGPPVNWRQKNRWGILDVCTNDQCLYDQGIDSCNCTDEDRKPADKPDDECEDPPE